MCRSNSPLRFTKWLNLPINKLSALFSVVTLFFVVLKVKPPFFSISSSASFIAFCSASSISFFVSLSLAIAKDIDFGQLKVKSIPTRFLLSFPPFLSVIFFIKLSNISGSIFLPSKSNFLEIAPCQLSKLDKSLV